MNNENIKKIILSGKTMSIEFKECKFELSKTVYETVCAFSNRIGGVNDDLLNFISKNPGKRLNAIANLLQLPYDTLDKKMRKLKKEGKIKFIGALKTGSYYIKINEIYYSRKSSYLVSACILRVGSA